MPELPEVETVTRGIQSLIGQHITNIIIRNPNLRYKIDPELSKLITGQNIRSISRRAKYIILELSRGFLIIHLGMSGHLTLLDMSEVSATKHDHVDIIFETHRLRYNDQRRFGLIMYVENLHTCTLLNRLGPEPLSADFTPEYLASALKNKKSTIKQLIMDNHIVVGVGNIYACEALFGARISPLRSGTSLNPGEINKLVAEIKQVLSLAIELGGSSLRDYKKADGNLGYFQNVHKVYGKAGKTCTVCGNIIQEIRLGQRNSFYCPNCQL